MEITIQMSFGSWVEGNLTPKTKQCSPNSETMESKQCSPNSKRSKLACKIWNPRNWLHLCFAEELQTCFQQHIPQEKRCFFAGRPWVDQKVTSLDRPPSNKFLLLHGNHCTRNSQAHREGANRPVKNPHQARWCQSQTASSMCDKLLQWELKAWHTMSQVLFLWCNKLGTETHNNQPCGTPRKRVSAVRGISAVKNKTSKGCPPLISSTSSPVKVAIKSWDRWKKSWKNGLQSKCEKSSWKHGLQSKCEKSSWKNGLQSKCEKSSWKNGLQSKCEKSSTQHRASPWRSCPSRPDPMENPEGLIWKLEWELPCFHHAHCALWC